MTQYTKPTVLPAWAESAGGADVLQPSNAEIQAGWPLSNVPPSRKRFNWVLKYLAQGVRYLLQRGIPEWDAAEDYRVNDRVQGSNGKTYRCIQAGINQDPTTATAYWALWGADGRDDQLQLTTAFTTAGTSPNYTLTPVPAPAALAANLRFRVKFHADGADNSVINIAGLGNKALKQYDSSGAKVPAIPVINQLVDIEYDGTDFVLLDPLPAPALGLKNLLINSNFAVNQRAYVSGTATSVANQYTLDRWRVVTSGQNVSWTSSGNTNTITAPAGGIEQVIEGNNIFGGIYCLSWTGNATATINGTAISNGGRATLPGGTNCTIRFSGGTVSKAQLEKGNNATLYEERPFLTELQMCQRYYESGVANWMIQLGGSTTNGNQYCYYSHSIYYHVKKRVAPTITKSTPAANPYVPFVGATSDTDAMLLTNSPNYVGQVPSSQNAFSLTWTADAEL